MYIYIYIIYINIIILANRCRKKIQNQSNLYTLTFSLFKNLFVQTVK